MNGTPSSSSELTNYVAYLTPSTKHSRIGHLDLLESKIQPLSFSSGTFITSLYQVIEASREDGEQDGIIIPSGSPIAASSVTILPPISGRDVLAVGKNYADHAAEFNKSGYDSSDKVDIPTNPVIFTKRATSIIADGEEIYPHEGFTESLDYEGELGVIVGKTGFRVGEEDAWEFVWGYTIVNDVTARERQRDHKQFFIGKSADGFCPMGPIAVPAHRLPKVLRVQTHVNGEKRQDATTEDLIFSIPILIKTISEGQTLQPGDVIATGTPAGVGIGKTPPVFLQSGDVVEVSVTGLGTLRNKIASASSTNYTISRVQEEASSIPVTNLSKSCGGIGLSTINSKSLYYSHQGQSTGSPIVFVHGLGGTSEYYTPLTSALSLYQSHPLHLFDLEGHGLSPTSGLSQLSVSSFASDLSGVFSHAKITADSGATLIAHSMGCLVALTFALRNPSLVKNLILIGPPPSPLPEAACTNTHARATMVREKGMAAVVDAIASAGTSVKTKESNPLALAAVRMSLLSQEPEAYAKACSALAGATTKLDIEKLEARVLIVTGEEDKVSPPALCEKMGKVIKDCKVVVLNDVGHWHVFEDVEGVSKAVGGFLKA
ncbi:MAG: hypothetical protein M1827_007581 [Pycnora praestabilis]|nr:MAG: hypothetical protein M1827_007581 [Pycnora praestabilis]